MQEIQVMQEMQEMQVDARDASWCKLMQEMQVDARDASWCKLMQVDASVASWISYYSVVSWCKLCNEMQVMQEIQEIQVKYKAWSHQLFKL